MPPRYAYWTILIDGKPTAFRAREQEELQPTFTQLARTNKDVAWKFFVRGKLWDSPEQAQWASKSVPPARERRNSDWRPGGAHKDPRAKFDKKARAREERRRETPRAAFTPHDDDLDDETPIDPAPTNEGGKLVKGRPPRPAPAPAPARAEAPAPAPEKRDWRQRNDGPRPRRDDRDRVEQPRFRRDEHDRRDEPRGRRDEGDREPARPHRPLPVGPKPRTGQFDRDSRSEQRPSFERKPFDKPTGRKPFGKKPFGDKPLGARPFAKKPFGERPFGEKPSGEKPYGAKPFARKPFGQKPFGDRSFGDKPQGARPPGRPPSGEKPFGGKPFAKKPFGSKPFGKKPFGKPAGSPGGSSAQGERPRFRNDNDRDRPARPREDRGDRPQSPSGERPPKRWSGKPRFDKPPRKPR